MADEQIAGLAIGAVFLLAFTAVPYWFYLIYRLDRHMKAHQPELHAAMGVGGLLPGRANDLVHFDNSGPVRELAKFLWHRHDKEIGDPVLTGIARSMRRFGTFFVGCLLAIPAVLMLSGAS